MTKEFILLLIFFFSEVLIAFVFAIIAQIFYQKIGLDFKAIFKGIIERLFLFITLINGYTQALTFFSALKLATRLKHNDNLSQMEGFNDYYLLGNLISVSVAIFYVWLFKDFEKIHFLKILTH